MINFKGSPDTDEEDYGDEDDEQMNKNIAPLIVDYLNDVDGLYLSGRIPFAQYKAYDAIVNNQFSPVTAKHLCSLLARS